MTTGVQSSDAKDRSESAQHSGFGRHVREDLGGLRGDRFLAYPETDRGIGRDAEHHMSARSIRRSQTRRRPALRPCRRIRVYGIIPRDAAQHEALFAR